MIQLPERDQNREYEKALFEDDAVIFSGAYLSLWNDGQTEGVIEACDKGNIYFSCAELRSELQKRLRQNGPSCNTLHYCSFNMQPHTCPE